ncbi:hypothetical protein BU16DRAFT_491253 [Lophium mytilinum]|uniref:Steroid 5-alpha reductase C-terminal domain-containing protein n=1 Tax=Lophium mytilinum TaxID=390894 RepID=A0A6A6QHU7_9PEZI|nr:hypothetical protein BU16DRAFT_491253 [Lophium mytilinum]
MADSVPEKKELKRLDLITRGDHGSTPLGSALFVALRALDPLLQYQIFANGFGTALLHGIGLSTVPQGLPVQTGLALVDWLGLSPYRLFLFGMAVGSMLKQNIWLLFISKDPMPVPASLAISSYNTILNSLNNYLFLCTATSASLSGNAKFPQLPLIIGGTMYVVGILTELVAEIQRAAFKRDPKNKGRAYTGGLWQVARHVNYTGYSLWRAGYAMAGGGFTFGVLVASFLVFDFTTRAVPNVDEYCTKRYGQDWVDFKIKVPYKILPGIY